MTFAAVSATVAAVDLLGVFTILSTETLNADLSDLGSHNL